MLALGSAAGNAAPVARARKTPTLRGWTSRPRPISAPGVAPIATFAIIVAAIARRSRPTTRDPITIVPTAWRRSSRSVTDMDWSRPGSTDRSGRDRTVSYHHHGLTTTRGIHGPFSRTELASSPTSFDLQRTLHTAPRWSHAMLARRSHDAETCGLQLTISPSGRRTWSGGGGGLVDVAVRCAPRPGRVADRSWSQDRNADSATSKPSPKRASTATWGAVADIGRRRFSWRWRFHGGGISRWWGGFHGGGRHSRAAAFAAAAPAFRGGAAAAAPVFRGGGHPCLSRRQRLSRRRLPLCRTGDRAALATCRSGSIGGHAIISARATTAITARAMSATRRLTTARAGSAGSSGPITARARSAATSRGDTIGGIITAGIIGGSIGEITGLLKRNRRPAGRLLCI